MHALLLLPQNHIRPDALRRVHSFIEGIDPLHVVQTELQENDAILGRGLQFEHFNAASLLMVSQHRPIFDEALLRASLDHIAHFMRADGCAASTGGRLYSWSTAHCIRALLATTRCLETGWMRKTPNAE
jgi:hypothetical protein